MQKVKTLFIFTFMVVILFGAYHVIYTRPDTPPPEVAKELDNLPDALELDLGTEISAEDLLNGLNDNAGLSEESSVVTAADDGQFESPAAGQLDEEITTQVPLQIESGSEPTATNEIVTNSGIENPLIDTVDANVGTEAAGDDAQFVISSENSTDKFPVTESDDSQFQPGNSNDAFAVTETNNSNDAFPVSEAPNDNSTFSSEGSPPQSQLETPVFNDDNIFPANNVTEQNPLSTPSAFATAWAAAQQQIETGHLREALQALSTYYGSNELTGEQQKQLLPVLDYLAGEVVYSRKHYLFESYTVGPNDSLDSIAFQLRVPSQLLANINGLRSVAVLKAGDELKIVQGPFRGEINVSNKELTLFVGVLYAGRFQIQLGSEFNPQPGQYSVLDKQLDRSYYAADGSIIRGGAMNNPYGKYWMDLGGNISIHTQPQDAGSRDVGLGSIKLKPVDARDVYHILSAGSQVTIR
ncbi:MAG: hypothetical protein CMJ76_04320 [Planctomycetaceae bacterium]|nr:hypothetical protein [Planctomycetaceae bacterium]